MEKIKQEIKELLKTSGVSGEVELNCPPSAEMGDLAFSCFGLSKEMKKNPNEIAVEIAKKINGQLSKREEIKILEKVESKGPYVNFYFNSSELAKQVLRTIEKDKEYGKNQSGRGKKIMVEFAHPNTHKAFHIGHLRNIITGESIARLLENSGFEIVRANYQGDVGMHIAKCLWGITNLKDEYEEVKKKNIKEKAAFLGKAYALGGTKYLEDEKIKQEIIDFNDKIYTQDESILELYKETRQWSLAYFDSIYDRVDTHFDRLYFESEVFERGREIVLEFLKKGVFEKSDGAVIFPGEKYGLHNRVFINSKGFPTYEAKDMALAEKQFSEYDPDKIIHIVGKEQSEYFKVIFKAMEEVLPKSIGKEQHFDYGWVSLKEGKMSSRTGQVVLGEWLLDKVERKVAKIMKENKSEVDDERVKKIGLAAVKYGMLKTGVKNDIKFSLDESVKLSGDSGPYLLYIIARVKSILSKNEKQNQDDLFVPNELEPSEKKLALKLAEYPLWTTAAAQELDPSKIARFLFELAQSFNGFYQECPIIKSEGEVKNFRLSLITAVEKVMSKGLDLLGIKPVEKM